MALADKICRGSPIGEAHNAGTWVGSVQHPDHSRFGRGTHITVHSNKLETTSPGGNSCRQPTDTFRESADWFKHDAPARQGESPRGHGGVPQLGHGFWSAAQGRSPGQQPRQPASFSQPGYSGDFDERAAKREARSPNASPRVNPPLDDGARSPGGKRRLAGLRSSQSDVFLSSPSSTAVRRTNSPTYETSEDWMGYSSPGRGGGSPRVPDVKRCVEELMPSRNFNSRARRQHSGRQVEAEAHKIICQDNPEVGPVDAPIANAIDSRSSRGRKCHITKPDEGMRGRLIQDESQKEDGISHRKQDFVGSSATSARSTPRGLPPRAPGASSPRGGLRTFTPGGLLKSAVERSESANGRLQEVSENRPVNRSSHQTSDEMARVLMPGEHSDQILPEHQKFRVGAEVVTWNRNAKRPATTCMTTVASADGKLNAPPPVPAHLTHHLSTASSYNPPLRDHRNSDEVKFNLQPPMPQAASSTALNVLGSVSPAAANSAAGLRTELPRNLTFGCHIRPKIEGKDWGGEFEFDRMPKEGDYAVKYVSSLSSVTNKNNAILDSGLRMVKYGTVKPGLFSPLSPRAQAAPHFVH